jgi:3-deoxy-manno-octulosonate cytidylyltransferase (CMP-KDO synthetase)
MKYLGVIPARLGSTRLERKPLQSLLNKPLILWVCEAVKKSKKLEKFVVATDSLEVFDVVQKAGFEAEMTSEACASGTDRALEVANKFEPQFIINIQGDEPLIKAEEIDALIEFIEAQNQECWATLGHQISAADLENKNAVKVVLNQHKEALYFSRYPIPYSRNSFEPENSGVLKHVGLYAYTFKALKKFCENEPCELEKAESLEQLRALYLGTKIFVKKTKYESVGVDTLEDLKKVEDILKRKK